MSDTQTLTRRSIAHLARVHAQGEAGKPTEGAGKRGRVSEPVVLAFLADSKPATVREIGAALGVTVPKGKVSAKTLTTLAQIVARNAPKQ